MLSILAFVMVATFMTLIMTKRLSALLLLVVATRIMDKSEYGLLVLVVTIGEMSDGPVVVSGFSSTYGRLPWFGSLKSNGVVSSSRASMATAA